MSSRKGTPRRLGPHTLVENVVQAVARDLLVAQAAEAERAGLRVRFSLHDELVVATKGSCKCPRRDHDHAGLRLADLHEADCPWIVGRKRLADVMSSVPTSLPGLEGLPVACEVSDTVRERWTK